MSLMFMLLTLVGAVVVLGGGSYVLRTFLARMESHDAFTEPEPPPRVGPDPHVGGYVPAPRDPEGRRSLGHQDDDGPPVREP